MSRRPLLIFVVVAVALVASTYLPREEEPAPAASVSVTAGLEVRAGLAEGLTTQEAVVFWRGRADRSPKDYISATNLGRASSGSPERAATWLRTAERSRRCSERSRSTRATTRLWRTWAWFASRSMTSAARWSPPSASTGETRGTPSAGHDRRRTTRGEQVRGGGGCVRGADHAAPGARELEPARCTDYTPSRRLIVSGPPTRLGVEEAPSSEGGPDA